MEIFFQKPNWITKKLLLPNHVILQQLGIDNISSTYTCYNKLIKKVSIIRIIDTQNIINKFFKTSGSPLINELLPALEFKISNLKTITGYNIGRVYDLGINNSDFYYCSEFIHGTNLEYYIKEVTEKNINLNRLSCKLLILYKGLHIHNTSLPYIESSSLILRNNKTIFFANFNPKYFFIKYTFPICYAEKFIICRNEKKYFINSEVNIKTALFCASKILYRFAKKIELNSKTKDLKQKLAICLSKKFKKNFSTFLGFYFFFVKRLKKPNKFKFNKLGILILRKKMTAFKNCYYFCNSILPKLIIKIVHLIIKIINLIIVISLLLVLTNFFLRTKKNEIRIDNDDLSIASIEKPGITTKSWSSTSAGWIVSNEEIKFVCQSEEFTTFVSNYSFFIENAEKYKEIAAIVDLEEITLVEDAIQSRIDKISRQNLNSLFYYTGGGVFFLSKNRAFGIIVKLTNQCQIVELKRNPKKFQMKWLYEAPCDSKNARILLRIDPKKNLIHGMIENTKFSIKPKTKIKNTTWRRAFGCSNINCSFEPKI